jgi:hypothetical protein
MAENKSFSWIPFYQELAEKLLEYKDKRENLVQFVYSLGDCSSFIKKDDGSEVEDIDPFTAFAIFNRQIGDAKRVKIAKSFKDYFSVIAEVPDDFLGIPVMNNQRSTFFFRQTSSEQIPLLWDLFEAELNDNISKLIVTFDSLQKFQGIKWNLTIGMYWIRPYSYMPLDELSRNYLTKIGVDVFKETDINGQNYLSLLDTIKKKIENNEIEEKHIPEISHVAFEKSEGRKYYYAGFSFGGKDSQLDRFMKDGVWEGSGNKTVNTLIQKVKIGDVLILKSSSVRGTKTPNPIPFIKISAVGIVQSAVKLIDNSDHYGFYVRYIKVEPKRDFDGNQFGKYRQTLHLCNDKEVIDFVNPIIEQSMIPEKVNKYGDVLRLKKNIILQGAPGTGKTYNTAALALVLCGVKDGEKFSVIEEDINKEYVMDYSKHDIVMKRYEQMRYDKKNNPDGQIGFCTFHQSMDYEDFVEGIKPVKPDEGELYYKVESGIFRIMCKNASNPKQVKQEKSLDLAFDDLIQDIVDGEVKTIPLKNGGMSNLLSVSPQLTIKWETANHELDVNCVSKERLLKLCESFDSKEDFETMTNINKAIRKEIGGCNASYYWAVAHYLLETIDIDCYDVIPQNYVLIIDEINRGNVSKIFGELITLLEADKRIGGDHPIRVTLPYSKESFGVPSNLYIIGTMNTTDRGVGNIDYAVRRRFAFATLKADEELVKQNSIPLAVELFGAVESFIKKHQIDMDFEDLMVGHSYFFAKDENELELKWQYEILPLLNEYIKDGIINAKAINSDKTVADFLLA